MAKKATEGPNDGMTFDMGAIEETKQEQRAQQYQPVTEEVAPQPVVRRKVHKEEKPLINCLRPEIIIVQHIAQPNAINDPKHVLHGGMAETARHTYTVPRLRSTGNFVNVLTDSEKAYLEYAMGLEEDALSIYRKDNNFWDNTTEGGISTVTLSKEGTQLHLDNPVDYIRYKILLAHKNHICPDQQTLIDRPKATYQFVLISNSQVTSMAKTKMTTKMQCYMEYGKIENNVDMLKGIVELLTSKPVAATISLDALQTTIGQLIESDSKLFLATVKNELLPTQILIKKAVSEGFISKRGDYFYLRSDGSPLCEGGENPTLSTAAKYLNNPKRQEMKLSLMAKINMR